MFLAGDRPVRGGVSRSGVQGSKIYVLSSEPGTNLGVFVPIWPVITPASSCPAIQEQTNTPKFVPPRRGRPPFDPTQAGLCKWVCLEFAECSLLL